MKNRVEIYIPGMENYMREDGEVGSMEDNEKIILTRVKNSCRRLADGMLGKVHWCYIMNNFYTKGLAL